MRFSFDLPGPTNATSDGRLSLTPSSSSTTPNEELQWLPLQNHPLFTAATPRVEAAGYTTTTSSKMPTNLLAWDGASRLYFWDNEKRCLHRISIRLGEPDPTSVLAATPSKVLRADVELNYQVHRISINRNGSALFLAGLDDLRVMFLYGRTSGKENTIICRTVSVGSDIYFDNAIRMLQIAWHPYSDTHLGILSSDSVFRIFDLSSSQGQAEQEYYLQPLEPGGSRNAASICPIDFSFGGNHLWDRLSVFILFSDGSIYVLCPVIPFGSVYKWESVLEIYNDAHTFGLKSANSKAVSNSNLAISWLEATFPDLASQEAEDGSTFALRAQPYALFDASVSLQGPLRKLCHGLEENSKFKDVVSEGRAVSFLYNSVSKDSILVTAWAGGHLQIDALADEVQPVWNVGSPPRVRVDSNDRILGIAMICESTPNDLNILEQLPDRSDWLGDPPPLLKLALVDLALPRRSCSPITMFADPLVPERIYCLHEGGIDSIVLHFLPFSYQSSVKEEAMMAPSVHPVLSTCPGESSPLSPLCGVLTLSDSYGDSWIVGLTSSSHECVVMEMKTWNMLLPQTLDKEPKLTSAESPKETDTPTIISKDLLDGPKIVLLPPSSPNLRAVSADSIEGRSTLHQYFKLFHENYVEYAHKVYFELQHHAPHLKKIIDNQHSRLREAEQKLSDIDEKQEKLERRIERAIEVHSDLEERLKNLRNLPGANKKPLSKAEREFKMELDGFNGVELDALHSSIEALTARLKRHTHSPQANLSNQHRQISARRKNQVQQEAIAQLRSSIEKLSLVNNENTKKVKLVESTLRSWEKDV